MIRWKNKLDIDDCNIQVLRAKDYEYKEENDMASSTQIAKANQSSDLKEIIISFKQIYINTYNVICMDISKRNEGQNKLVFRHERF